MPRRQRVREMLSRCVASQGADSCQQLCAALPSHTSVSSPACGSLVTPCVSVRPPAGLTRGRPPMELPQPRVYAHTRCSALASPMPAQPDRAHVQQRKLLPDVLALDVPLKVHVGRGDDGDGACGELGSGATKGGGSGATSGGGAPRRGSARGVPGSPPGWEGGFALPCCTPQIHPIGRAPLSMSFM